MVKTTLATLMLLLAFSTAAQTPPLPATYVTNTDIQAFLGALPKDTVSDMPIRVADVGGYHVAVYGVLRPKFPQKAVVHNTKITEIYYILSGTATLVTGGMVTDSIPIKGSIPPTANGTRINGGVSRKVGPGDVVIIPGKTPHWFSSQDVDLRYLIFRTDPEGTIPLK